MRFLPNAMTFLFLNQRNTSDVNLKLAKRRERSLRKKDNIRVAVLLQCCQARNDRG